MDSASTQRGTVGSKKTADSIIARCEQRPTPGLSPAPKACGAIVSIAASGAVMIILPATLKARTPTDAPAKSVAVAPWCPTRMVVMDTIASLMKSTSAMGSDDTKKPQASRAVTPSAVMHDGGRTRRRSRRRTSIPRESHHALFYQWYW